MRHVFRFVSLAVVVGLAPVSRSASAQSYAQTRGSGQIDVSIFYDGLSPYGDWVEMPDYGWSFAPRVDRDWRPYTRGQWIWTDDGWYWDSDEEFGWAAYHYGRWVNDRYYGWVWVPGTEWAPAWVSWRHGHGYTGWAPLPPRAQWRTRIGLNIGGLDIDAYIGVRDYSFVPDRSFVDRGLYQRVLPPTQNITIINETTNVTNYTIVNQRIVNGGIPVTSVEQAVGRSVPRSRTVEVARVDAPRHAVAGEVSVYRPTVRTAPDRRPAQGRSLVKGEAVPPLLVERKKERDQERQQGGNRPDPTALDAARKQRPAAVQQTAPAPVGARPGTSAPPQPVRPPRARPEPTRPSEAQPQPERRQPQAERRQPQERNQDREAQRQQQRDEANQAQQQKAQQQRDQADRTKQERQAQPRQRDQTPPQPRSEPPQAAKPPKAGPAPAKGNPHDKGNKKDPKPTPTAPAADGPHQGGDRNDPRIVSAQPGEGETQ